MRLFQKIITATLLTLVVSPVYAFAESLPTADPTPSGAECTGSESTVSTSNELQEEVENAYDADEASDSVEKNTESANTDNANNANYSADQTIEAESETEEQNKPQEASSEGEANNAANEQDLIEEQSNNNASTVKESTDVASYEKQYSLVYNYGYYKGTYADLVKAFGNDRYAYLTHFLKYGMGEGRQANSKFDVHSYYNQYWDLRKAYGSDLKQYYYHYMNYGNKEGRKTSGQESIKDYITTSGGINYTAVYDAQYYYSNNADLKRAFTFYGTGKAYFKDQALIDHFVEYGMNEGRLGSNTSKFNIVNYFNSYQDLRNAFGTDLRSYYKHYITYGKKEGRAATGNTTATPCRTSWAGTNWANVYEATYYINKYGDLKRVFSKTVNGNLLIDDRGLLKHFYDYGMKERRQAKSNFDVLSYYREYKDLRRACGGNWREYYKHYINYGAKEGRHGTGYTKLISGDATLDSYLLNIISDYPYMWDAFQFICNCYYYREQDLWPGDSDAATIRLAKEMYEVGGGNCYRYAAITRWVAAALGYDSSVHQGWVRTRSGRAEHAWTLIYNNGTYVCDGSFGNTYGAGMFYMVTYANARVDYIQ